MSLRLEFTTPVLDGEEFQSAADIFEAVDTNDVFEVPVTDEAIPIINTVAASHVTRILLDRHHERYQLDGIVATRSELEALLDDLYNHGSGSKEVYDFLEASIDECVDYTGPKFRAVQEIVRSARVFVHQLLHDYYYISQDLADVPEDGRFVQFCRRSQKIADTFMNSFLTGDRRLAGTIHAAADEYMFDSTEYIPDQYYHAAWLTAQGVSIGREVVYQTMQPIEAEADIAARVTNSLQRVTTTPSRYFEEVGSLYDEIYGGVSGRNAAEIRLATVAELEFWLTKLNQNTLSVDE